MNRLHTNMDISIKMSISQSIIIAKSAIKTFLISLSILLHSAKYKQRRTSEDYLRLFNILSLILALP